MAKKRSEKAVAPASDADTVPWDVTPADSGVATQDKTQDRDQPQDQAQAQTQGTQEAGDTLNPNSNGKPNPPSIAHAGESRAQATNRWVSEGRKRETDAFRHAEILNGHDDGLGQEAARERAWQRTIAKFPPPPKPALVTLQGENPPDRRGEGSQVARGSDRVSGLKSLPACWPALPANASLAAEIAWVQAVRLDVVEELASGGTVVHLDRASAPAPSKAALSWLETSIRSYAKYVEVAAKASVGDGDDQTKVRRERMRIEEIRELLRQMR